MTNDRPIHKLNYQWEASIHYNWQMVGQYDVIFYRHYKSFLILVFKLVHFWLELEQKDVYLKILSRKRGKIETKIEEEHETAKLNVNQNHFNNKVSSWNYFSYLSIGGNSTIYIQVIFRLCMAYSLSPFFLKSALSLYLFARPFVKFMFQKALL